MGRNLGPLNIKDSYEGLVQISGSQLTDGSGSLISSLDVTASDATTATTASYVAGANVDGQVASALSSSYALTASFAENAPTPTLQQVTDEGNTTTNSIIVTDAQNRTYGGSSITSNTAGGTYSISGGTSNAALALSGNGGTDNVIRVNPAFGVEITGSTAFQDEITIDSTAAKTLVTKGGVEISSSTAPTLEIQSTTASLDPSVLFQSGSTYVGFIAGTATALEIGDFANNKVKVSGSSLEVDVALTASGLNYPTADGTNGQVLTTDGAGNLTLEDAAGGSPFPFTGSAEITGSLGITGSNTTIGISDKISIERPLSDSTTAFEIYPTTGGPAGGTYEIKQTGGYGVQILPTTNGTIDYAGRGGQTYTHFFSNGLDVTGTGLRTSTGVPAILQGALTASGLIYPDTDGTNGQVITTDGAGNLTFEDAGGGAAFPFTGDAVITGSLLISGSKGLEVTGPVDLNNRATAIAPSGSDPDNVLIGPGAGEDITSGARNVCIGGEIFGVGAGESLTTGNENILIGAGAGRLMVSNNGNVAIGNNTFFSANNMTDTTTVGKESGRDANNMTTGVMVGKWSGYGASGNNLIAVGYRSGWKNSGNNNIFIGENVCGQTASTFSNSYYLALGSDVEPSDSLLYGYHGTDSTPGDRFLTVDGLINAGQYSSAPTGAGVQAGSIYYDTSTNKLRCYNGTIWNDLF